MSEKNEHTTQVQSGPSLRGTVENKAAKPAGLLPKNTQQFVILGVAVVMLLIMWLTGGAKRIPKSTTGAISAAPVEAPDRAAVQDFKQTIQKEQAATRQPISASDLARLQALGLAGDVPSGSTVMPPDGSVPSPGGVIGGSAQETPAPSDPVKEDKKKRGYMSLFATNVAFTYRKGEYADKFVSQRPNTSETSGSSEQRTARPSSANDLETQLHEGETQFLEANRAAAQVAQAGPIPAPVSEQQARESTPTSPNSSQPGAFNSSTGKQYVVFEGTILETLLMNHLNGTFAGPVNCLVTSDIYSHDGQHILIPDGTKVLGEAKKVEGLGQQRLAVSFHRLVMPDGFSVNLDQFRGLNQIGETALRDKVNNHYLETFGASLAIGILGGIAEAGTGNVLTNSPLDQARTSFGSSLANSSMQILDRFLNILPTVTVREGSRVKVYLSGDILLPDYGQHNVQPDM